MLSRPPRSPGRPKPSLHRWIGKGGVNFLVQPIGDRGRSIFRGDDTKPGTKSPITGISGSAGERVKLINRKRAQLTRPDVIR
jgi:hypothetical protein